MNIRGQKEPHDTPCTGNCTATAIGDIVCKGCGRTRQEVQDWNLFTKLKKTQINQRLQGELRKKARPRWSRLQTNQRER
jgi:predicted Fe-S protein YdhL (DUF1289 family)